MTTNEDKTLLNINLEDLLGEEIRVKISGFDYDKTIIFYLEALRSHLSVSHMATHFFVLKHSTRVLTLTCRSWCSVGKRVTMGGILHFEIPSLDCALEAFSDGCALNVNELTRSKMSHADHISSR